MASVTHKNLMGWILMTTSLGKSHGQIFSKLTRYESWSNELKCSTPFFPFNMKTDYSEIVIMQTSIIQVEVSGHGMYIRFFQKL